MVRLALILAAFCLITWPCEAGKLGPEIYDTKANGKILVAEAIQRAKEENKHVLLEFGANWCSWCHLLHGLFASDRAIREKLKTSFVLVMIDVNEDRNADLNVQYGKPTLRGLPVLVVLDAEGNQVFTQETGAFEKGKKHDPEKVLAFLKRW